MTPIAQRKAQLVLALEAGDGAADRLAAIVAAVPVASVIVTAAPGRTLEASGVTDLIRGGQKAGAAMLVAGDAQFAKAVSADGVYLPYSETIVVSVEAARAVLGGRPIVGADAGRSRHDAMSLGEIGTDVVAFGIPDFVKDRETAIERQIELVEWWAEIFEIPCLAMDVANVADAEALAAAGADFVCLTVASGDTLADAVEVARRWFAAIAADSKRAR
jgi:thiamine-phosphate pyrophosphorylase